MIAAPPRKRRRARGDDGDDTAATMILRSSKRAPPAAMFAPTSSSKRRRPRCADTALATVDASPPDVEESPWVSLPADLVRIVGSRLLADAGGDGMLDYVRFRAVCGYWRSSTVSPRGRGVVEARFYPARWVMLPEGHGLHPGHRKLRGYVRFFNLSTGVIVRVKLPLFRDHCILDSVDGLLLLQRDHDTAVRLLNPLTGDIAELPPLSSIPQPASSLEPKHAFLAKLRGIGATCIRVSTDGTITVMIAISGLSTVAFATAGDHQWRLANWKFMDDADRRIYSLQGKLYLLLHFILPPTSRYQAITQIMQIDMPCHGGAAGSPLAQPPPPKAIIAFSAREMFTPLAMAECGSEIMVVGSSCNRDSYYTTIKLLRLADLAMETRTARPVRSIGPGNVLMLGERCLSVSTRALPNLAGDSVVTAGLYFFRKGHFFDEYHLGSATWSVAADVPRDVEHIWSSLVVPRPLNLIYHVITCCYPHAWNKGGIWLETKNYKWKVKRKWRIGA